MGTSSRTAWLVVPILFSSLFVVLFLPVVLRTHGAVSSFLLTLAGVAVIWAAYLVRARFMTRGK